MSIFELWMYTTVIPGVGGVLSFVAAAGIMVLTGCLIVGGFFKLMSTRCPEFDESKQEARIAATLLQLVKKYAIPFIVIALLSGVIPNQKQMLTIAGGHVATNNKDIKKMAPNAAKAVNAWLEAMTEKEY